MINFYHTWKFPKLTINFSKLWPRQIFDLGKQFNLMISLENILNTSLQEVLKTSWRRMTMTNILVLIKTSWKRLKTSSEGVWVRRIYSSWSRRLQDVLKTSSEDEDERRVFAGKFYYFLIYEKKLLNFLEITLFCYLKLNTNQKMEKVSKY